MWFEQLTGFTELGAAQVRQMLTLQEGKLISRANGKAYNTGRLEMPTLAQLEQQAQTILQQDSWPKAPITVQEVIADAQSLHADPANAGALFQVASQFNLLEMVGPTVTPDSGVTGYQFDKTQGPACAIACGAGLIYRNYYVPMAEGIGQTANQQLNMLEEFEQALLPLVNADAAKPFARLWLMKNGYVLPDKTQLNAIHHTLSQLNAEQTTALLNQIKIGVQFDSEVTLQGAGHNVTQAYCSAMPVAYCHHSMQLWQPLACLILQAAYRATLAAAVVNAANTGNRTVFLTLLGGGAFGNAKEWIIDAVEQALERYKHSGLQVKIVSYGRSKPGLSSLLTQ